MVGWPLIIARLVEQPPVGADPVRDCFNNTYRGQGPLLQTILGGRPSLAGFAHIQHHQGNNNQQQLHTG